MPQIDEKVRAEILSTIEKVLSNHLISKRAYPKEVIIKTVYDECTQTLIIGFDNKQED